MVTIGRDDRNALYGALVLDISEVDDVFKLLAQGRGEEAREDRERFENDWAVLDLLGWDGNDRRQSFDLAMPREELEPVIRRLLHEAEDCLETLSPAEDDWREWADVNLDLRTACQHVLDGLATAV